MGLSAAAKAEVITFDTPTVIVGHAKKVNNWKFAPITITAKVKAPEVSHVQRAFAGFSVSGEIDTPMPDLYGPSSCEWVGPRLDGLKVQICNGAVTAYMNAAGDTRAYPYASR